MNPLIEELTWRGLIHNIMPGTNEQLSKETTTGYVGFDPTADSLHVGSLVPIILLKHLQNYGHQPIAIIGGATGMIGDPSGKSSERNLLDEETLEKNVAGIRAQLEQYLDFSDTKENKALLLNNYDWMKEFSFIEFTRDIGKHITVNYMMAKDSVKSRIAGENTEGMSFTEFTYQLIQGYDFLHLYKNYKCKLQMGGSDQWGNITTGTELIRKVAQGNAFAFTCPLTTKADGNKFGKSEAGENIWLDKNRTSVYKFYQFWLNTSDEDAEKYLKIYTFLTAEQAQKIIDTHMEERHQRLLQKTLAAEVTTWVHGKEALEKAVEASQILFGKSTEDAFKNLDTETFLDVFEGVPQKEITKESLKESISIIDALSEMSEFLSSKGEARRALKENSISVNQQKVKDDFMLTSEDLINDTFILLQRGKRKYFILKFQ